MSKSNMRYRDLRALHVAHCAMYRRLFRQSFDVSFLRELIATQRRLVALRYDV